MESGYFRKPSGLGKAVALEHHRDIAVFRFQPVDHFVTDPDLAFAQVFQPGDHPHGRGLAAARWPQQHQKLGIGDIKVEVINTHIGAPAFADIDEADLRHDLPFHSAGGQAGHDLPLEEKNEDEKRDSGRNNGGNGEHDVALVLDRAEETGDLGDHRLVFLPQQHRGDGKVVVAQQKAEQPSCNDAGPHHRDDHHAKRLKPCAAIDQRAFVQILGDRQEEAVQHPQGEGLVDRHQNDDRRRQIAPDVQLKERQQIAGYQRDMRHRAEYQCRNQNPERIAAARPRQRIAAQACRRSAKCR